MSKFLKRCLEFVIEFLIEGGKCVEAASTAAAATTALKEGKNTESVCE